LIEVIFIAGRFAESDGIAFAHIQKDCGSDCGREVAKLRPRQVLEERRFIL